MTFTDSITMQPSVAEQRRAVLIPAPFGGGGKKLQAEFAMLRARSDALETDRGHAALHRADFVRELDEMAESRTEAIEAKRGKPKTRRESIAENRREIE